MQHDVKITFYVGFFPDFHPDRRARREGNRLCEVSEWPITVRDSKSGGVQDRLALELPPRRFVAQRVEELDLAGWRAGGLEEFAQDLPIAIATNTPSVLMLTTS